MDDKMPNFHDLQIEVFKKYASDKVYWNLLELPKMLII